MNLHFTDLCFYKDENNHKKQRVAIPESIAGQWPSLVKGMFQLGVTDTGANSASVASIWPWTNFPLPPQHSPLKKNITYDTVIL